MSVCDTTLIIRAAAFAARKHRDQRRKDAAKSPYINHSLTLACILAEEGGVTDTEMLCAALLHDTMEDTETTPVELRSPLTTARMAGLIAVGRTYIPGLSASHCSRKILNI